MTSTPNVFGESTGNMWTIEKTFYIFHKIRQVFVLYWQCHVLYGKTGISTGYFESSIGNQTT